MLFCCKLAFCCNLCALLGQNYHSSNFSCVQKYVFLQVCSCVIVVFLTFRFCVLVVFEEKKHFPFKVPLQFTPGSGRAWALKVVDSAGKPGAGILQVNTTVHIWQLLRGSTYFWLDRQICLYWIGRSGNKQEDLPILVFKVCLFTLGGYHWVRFLSLPLCLSTKKTLFTHILIVPPQGNLLWLGRFSECSAASSPNGSAFFVVDFSLDVKPGTGILGVRGEPGKLGAICPRN